MTTQASQAWSETVQAVGSVTCTGGVMQAKLSLFGLCMLLLGCLVVDTSWAQGELSFTRRDLQVGDDPSSITVGDFNGDGQQDLATASVFGSVSILLGQGDGTFEPSQDFGLGTSVNPVSITVGDFNGDNQQDLATANIFGVSGGGTVSILLGQGDGTFERAQDVAAGPNPSTREGITVGDFNGDSQQDLATASSSGSAVSILLGNGDGSFEPAQIYEVGANPASITVGNFDGDSHQDLATANVNGDTVSILRGQGDGTFEPAQDFEVGDAPFSVTVGDFNGDSHQDLATANLFGGVSDTGSVSILLGQGDSTFEPAQDFSVGDNTSSVTVADFNSDGRQDLATSNSNAQTVSILLGNGDGTFEPAQDFGAGVGPISVTVGDFNGDGQQDVATANAFNVSVLINNTDVEVDAVKIDIKPGSFQNSINPKSKGKIPVAILTTESFDATTVDPTAVLFGRTGTEAAPVRFALKDVDGDGNTDMILHFKTQNTGIRCGDKSASLTGMTINGQAIEGSDSIRTVGCKTVGCK